MRVPCLLLALRLEHWPKLNGRRKRPWCGRGDEPRQTVFAVGPVLFGALCSALYMGGARPYIRVVSVPPFGGVRSDEVSEVVVVGWLSRAYGPGRRHCDGRPDGFAVRAADPTRAGHRNEAGEHQASCGQPAEHGDPRRGAA